MANTDAAFGLRPIKYRDGTPYNGGGNPYYVGTGETNDIFIGDPVNITGTANTTTVEVPGYGTFPAGTLPAVTLATAGAGNNLIGSVVGVGALPGDLTKQYRAASTERVLFVEDSPDVVYEIQEDSSTATLSALDVGNNADLASGTGSTVTGISAWELDGNTANTTATLQLRILRLVNRTDNAIGASAKWEVMINTHQHITDQAGV